MKILKIEQGTDEWLELRRTKVGGSDSPAINGKNPFKNVVQTWQEKAIGKKGFVSAAMQRGTDEEPKCRAAYENAIQSKCDPLVALHDVEDWMMASLDGAVWSGDVVEYIIEIKSPGERVLREVREGKVPEYWLWQCQHNMYVCDVLACVLLVWDGADYEEIPLQSDPEIQAQIVEAGREFMKKLMSFECPELPEDNYSRRDDGDWLAAAQRWLQAKNDLEDATKRKKAAEADLQELADGTCTKGCGVRATLATRKGSVDYSKIPELASVDVDAYRKKPVVYWTIAAQGS